MGTVTKPMLLNETGVAANALLTQIAQNIATIATQDTSNATLATLAKSIADEAKTISEQAKEIAKGATMSRVFDTETDMIAWLKDEENANVLKVGDNLYIKDTTVPDYFVSAVLNDANEDGFFYEYSRLATDKVDLTNVVTSDSDADTTIDNVFGDHEGVSKKISAANLASVVAQQIHDSEDAQSKVTFGKKTLSELESAVGTDLYGATTAAGLASVVAGVVKPMKAVKASDINTNIDEIKTNSFIGDTSADIYTGTFPTGFDKRYNWFGFAYFSESNIRGFQFMYCGDSNNIYVRYFGGTAWGSWKQV